MLITWMTMASLGMVVARYRNKFANGNKLWGKDVWFLVRCENKQKVTQINYF